MKLELGKTSFFHQNYVFNQEPPALGLSLSQGTKNLEDTQRMTHTLIELNGMTQMNTHEDLPKDDSLKLSSRESVTS